MKFKSEKGTLSGFLIFGIALPLMVFCLFDYIEYEAPGKILPVILIVLAGGFLLWSWFDTHYLIKANNLIYKCGPIKGTINIDSIHRLIKNKTSWSGLKPALSRKGIIIEYNRYDEIYISPIDKELFIKEILKINSKIEILE